MARGFRMGGAGGGAEPTPQREIIFENGVAKTYDNPGSFYWQSTDVTTGFAIGTNITLPSPYPTGKTRTVMAFRDINLTDYKSFVITYSAVSAGTVKYTTNTSGNLGLFTSLVNLTATSGDLTVETDITNITGTYNLIIGFNNDSQVVIKSIWLEPKDEAKFPVIYDHGSWSVGYDNATNYEVWAGTTAKAWTINPTNIYANSTSNTYQYPVIGTSSKVNLTNYSTLHVRTNVVAQRIEAWVLSTKDLTGTAVKYQTQATTSGYVEMAVDVSDLSDSYYLAFCCSQGSGGANGYIEKIWLT